MRDLRIRARNFLSHHNSEVKFDGFDSVVVLGPNGTGKSGFVVDAPLVALFGKGRSGDLDGYIRNGSTDMGVEYDFALNGHRYGVTRKRSKKTARGSSSLEFDEINEKGETIQQLTAGSNGGQDISEEPDVEAALRMWAKGRDGVNKFIDRLVAKGKEIEQKYNEVR